MGAEVRISWLRIAIVALLAVMVLEYVWVQVNPAGGKRNRGQAIFGHIGGEACPAEGKRGAFGQTDYEWQLTALDGTDTSLLRHKDRVLFINVWATWCGPCIAEMPEIQALFESLKGQGVAFLAISDEDRETVRKFVEEKGYTFPVYVTENVPDEFESRGIPATFVVDRTGGIVLKKTGAASWDTDTCRSFLRSLL